MQPDAAAFLRHIDDHAAPLFGDHPHCDVQLLAAVAALRAEDIAGETLRVHAHEGGFAAVDLTHAESDMLVVRAAGPVADQVEGAVDGGQGGLGDALDQLLGAQAVLDDLLNADHLDLVALGEADQFGQPRHFAVALHDLADHRAGLESGQAAEVDAGLGLAGAHQHAAFARPQREHVPGADEVVGGGVGIHQHLHGARAVGRGDAGRDAPCAPRR